MAKGKSSETYDEKEAQLRFEQALRGARIAGHKSMKEIVGKQPKNQRQPTKKKPAKKAG